MDVPVPSTLVLLSIIGPNVLSGNATTQYTAIATFSDGSSKPVVASWGTDSPLVTISNSGLLSAGEVSSNLTVTLLASFVSGAVTQTASKSVTVFNSQPTPTFTLTVKVTPNYGSVMEHPDQPTYASGTPVLLTPLAFNGYQFANWSGDASGSMNPLVVTMDTNKIIMANFVSGVSLPRLMSSSISNGIFRFTLQGVIGSDYGVQVSSDLVRWVSLSTNTIPPIGSLALTDPLPTGQRERFYRAILLSQTAPVPVATVLIPAGSFQMGDSFAEARTDDTSELPIHSVTVSAF